MSIKSWVISNGIVGILKAANKQKKINELADNIDKAIDDQLKNHSEKTQIALVRYVLIPLCRRLMKEQPMVYKKIINDELEGI